MLVIYIYILPYSFKDGLTIILLSGLGLLHITSVNTRSRMGILMSGERNFSFSKSNSGEVKFMELPWLRDTQHA